MSLRILSMSSNSILNHFLSRIIFRRIYPPFNSNAQILAAQFRYGSIISSITGKTLLKRNVKREAIRLRMYTQNIIDLATTYIWDHSTEYQIDQFTTLADTVNKIIRDHASQLSREDSIYRMTQITSFQETNCET
ncbi:3610_t:CDS:1, partial [Funneliformis caledonium]